MLLVGAGTFYLGDTHIFSQKKKKKKFSANIIQSRKNCKTTKKLLTKLILNIPSPLLAPQKITYVGHDRSIVGKEEWILS